MSKRSREASFSPSADSHSTSTPEDDEHETLRPVKISAMTDFEAHSLSAMQCSLPPHRQALDFPSIKAFELHYIKDHSNRCSSCDKNFPSAHFLSLHIDESHNSLRAEMQAKGEKTYACFVEDCEKKCSTPQKRRLHLVDKHLFPKSYNFRVVNQGIDKRTSMLTENKPHRRRVSTADAPADRVTRHRRASSQLLENTTKDGTAQSASPAGGSQIRTSPPLSLQSAGGEMDGLANSMSSLKFVPNSVRKQAAKKNGA